jgi:hypothetical protein
MRVIYVTLFSMKKLASTESQLKASAPACLLAGRLAQEVHMKLLTKAILKRFEQVGSQDDEKDPLIIVKFFNPVGAGTWFATEYNPETRIFFGYVSIFGDWNDEWGTFSLDELKSVKGMFGLGIERDLHFGEKRFSEVVDRYTRVKLGG